MSREIRELNKKAVNKSLKDYGNYGIKKDGSCRKGFVQLPDGRVVKRSELEGASG